MNKKVLKSQRKIKAVAWTNIFAQLAFPVAAAFTPATAVAESERKVVLTDSQLAELPVKPYVMKENDTLNSVASSYGLTLAQLRKLNQLRTFSSSFDNVKPGQEIDVPAVQIKDILPSATDAQAAKSSFESDLASASTRTADILQSSDISGSIAGQAKGLAVNQANQEINNWLNRAGTARAKLSVDNKGRLDGSELDMLIPLHDTPEAMTFTQFGVRHIDDRTMANLGVGQRFYPAGEWMYGYNAFFDYDLRRDHSRLGFGLEMARDYLKLGANSYFRTSNWRGSPDVTDFDERPANGFDLRTEAYIPALPQLGGSLAYEQYYGEDVGLFGKNNRSRNPAAFTAGLNYTPVPLLTLGVERKQGTTSSEGETRFNIGLTYDINGSWAQQIDPDTVNAKRTLAGSRYDLVERNNEIVLEYRKQEVIRLKVDSLVTGESGETKVINYSVNAKYGLGSVRWDDAALVAAGGSIKQDGDKFSVTLPPYTEGGVNSWIISSVAVDKKGNSSKRAETQVSVTSASISITESLFDSQEDVIPADSQSTSVITLKLEDGAGNPVTGLASEITLEALMPGATGTLPSFSSFREVSPGVYEAVMTAGSGFGKLTVTPSVRGVVLSPIVIDVVAPVAPVADALKLTGSLAVGNTLSGSYTYSQPQQTESSSRNVAALSDQSYYAWGEKGTTASAVSNGKPVSESGKIPGYTIQPSDVSKILELSLLPRNSANVSGKIITVDTSMSKEQGNESDGGNNGGQIIDATAAPKVADLKMGGSLSVGGSVTATYTFDPLTGSPKDASRYLWGESGTTEAGVDSSAQAVTQPGEVPAYVVQATDAGKVLEVSVKARNDRNVEGNKATQRSTDSGNNFTDGGNGGAVIDPAGAPTVADLKMGGSLSVGGSVTATYTFDPVTGSPNDASRYLWGESGTTEAGVDSSAQAVTQPGEVPAYVVQATDAGKVLEVSVKARNDRNVEGNKATQRSTDSGNNFTDGGNGSTVIDPAGAPTVADLKMGGSLSVGGSVTATYTFDPVTGSPKDASRYLWGESGTTEAGVDSSAQAVTQPGEVPAYVVQATDAGKVLEVSVKARNDRNVEGNKATQRSTDSGNNFTDGGNGGAVIDPAGAPKVADLKMGGSLSVGGSVTATYTFDPVTGSPKDASRYLWGESGTTEAGVDSSAQAVTQAGKVPAYVVQATDVGKVLEVSLKARNDRNVEGNKATQRSTDSGNNFTDGGNGGAVIDPAGAPTVADLKMGGSLSVGGSVTATYTFDPVTGSPNDASRYLWGESGTTEAGVDSSAQAVTQAGKVPAYVVQATDVGKVLEVSVKARNDRNVEGNKATQRSTDSGNNFTDGGNSGAVIDPNAIPSISGLTIKGTLQVGQSVTGSYTFVTNNGDATDVSKYVWGTPGSGATGAPASNINSGLSVPGDGTVPARQIQQQDSGQVIELAVQPRNALNKVGTTVTATSQTVGIVMASVPITPEYDQNFKFVKDASGNELRKLMWPYDGSNFAGGRFVFETKSPFTSTTKDGVLNIVADDNVESVIINGTSISLGSTCTWNQSSCSVPVNNLNVGMNTISVVANNAGSNGPGNPGALNLVLIAGGQNILTSDPDLWTFHK